MAETRKWTSAVGKQLYEDLTDEERGKIAELRLACKDVIDNAVHDDLYLIRFCRARKWKMDKVQEMLRAALKKFKDENVNWEAFSKEFKADPSIPRFPVPFVNHRYGVFRMSGKDKGGTPLMWAFVGRRDNIGLMRCMTADEWYRTCQYFLFATQWQVNHSTAPDVECEQYTLVIDMAEMSLRQALHGPFIRADKPVLSYMTDCMPETIKKILIVNCPSYFTFVWAVYKHFVDKDTRDKVSIHGKNCLPVLQELIDDDQIPKTLGGTSAEKIVDSYEYIIDASGNVEKVKEGDEPFLNCGIIPEKYYRAGLDLSNATTIIVGRGSTEHVEVPVTKVGSTVRWEFQSQDHDIGFGVYFKATGAKRLKRKDMEEIVASERVDAQVCPVEGAHTAEAEGVYVLRFDNTYSYLRGKSVTYITEVMEPSNDDVDTTPDDLSALTGERDGAVAAASPEKSIQKSTML